MFANLSSSDWINVICSCISVVVTVVIANLQIKQSHRMEAFEQRQNQRDEERHNAHVKAQATSFISRYYEDQGLIPLCVIASMHNRAFCYSRKMYREFCWMTPEVQNCILKHCNLNLRVIEIPDFFKKSIETLNQSFEENFPNDTFPFYENSKYMLRSLEEYKDQSIPLEYIDYNYIPKNAIKNMPPKFQEILCGRSRYNECMSYFLDEELSGTRFEKPILKLSEIYNFENAKEIEACQFVTTLAEYIAIKYSKNTTANKRYGTPGNYAYEKIETMEDLFLLSLFEIYTRLMCK